ncbi:hypothetical protein BKA56DRAFT_119887 [Ilyonectria sp. MPI-CAGE-AT-0026]|nr:hypothetical protein BKA56DRAFT_119887 [Ilyonectria sp. MPI-CAGE-AT-0026]
MECFFGGFLAHVSRCRALSCISTADGAYTQDRSPYSGSHVSHDEKLSPLSPRSSVTSTDQPCTLQIRVKPSHPGTARPNFHPCQTQSPRENGTAPESRSTLNVHVASSSKTNK